MAKTNKQLMDENKLLKNEIRKLRGEVKESVSELEGLNNNAFAMVLDEGLFKLATIKFNPESNKAAIDNFKVVGTGKSLVEASSYAKKAIVDELIKINKRR